MRTIIYLILQKFLRAATERKKFFYSRQRYNLNFKMIVKWAEHEIIKTYSWRAEIIFKLN
jgi:hypothetical protein